MSMVDAESLIVQYLSAQSEVTAYVSQRIYTMLPKSKTWPLVRVWRIGGSPKIQRPLYLDKAHLQVEVFGGSKVTALDISNAVLGELSKLPDEAAVQPLGVVSHVGFGSINAFMPDESFDPAKPRYVSDVFVTTRPAPLPTT